MLHYPEPPYWLSIVKSIIYMFSHIRHAGQIYFLQVNIGREGSWGLNHRYGAPQWMPLPLGYICVCVCYVWELVPKFVNGLKVNKKCDND